MVGACVQVPFNPRTITLFFPLFFFLVKKRLSSVLPPLLSHRQAPLLLGMDLPLLLLLLLLLLPVFQALVQESAALPLHPNAYLQMTEATDPAAICQSLRTPSSRVVLHRPTGLCVVGELHRGLPILGPCSESNSWHHTPQGLLVIEGAYFCLQAFSSGHVNLNTACSPRDSAWRFVPNSGKMQLVTVLPNGRELCMDAAHEEALSAMPCKCATGESEPCDLGSQWFELVVMNKHASPGTFNLIYKLAAVLQVFNL